LVDCRHRFVRFSLVSDSAALPVLAVAHGVSSVPVLATVEAAEGLCSLLWLVDSTDPAVVPSRRALERFGEVVDLAGLRPEDWSGAVAPRRPDGLLTHLDADMPAYARLAEDVGIPFFHSPEIALALTDKESQRRALRLAGVPSPSVVTIPASPTPFDVESLPQSVRYPAIVKPAVGSASRLTCRVDGPDELVAAVERCQTETGRPKLVVEDYLADTDPCLGTGFANLLSVESVVFDGRVEHFALAGRFPLAPPFRETGLFVPAAASAEQAEAARRLAEAAVEALGVRYGCLHTEIKVTPSGPALLEVNGRLGGGIPLVVSLATGGSALRMAMEVALGRPPDLAPFREPRGVAGVIWAQPPVGAVRVLDIAGLDELAEVDGIVSRGVHREPGSAVDWKAGMMEFVYSVGLHASDHERLRALYELTLRTVEVTYELEQSPP